MNVTPEHVKVLGAFFTLLNQADGWSIATMLFFILGLPPLALVYALLKLAMALISLREEVKAENSAANTRYENNVELVKDYNKIANDIIPLLQVNTEAMTRLGELIKQVLGKN